MSLVLSSSFVGGGSGVGGGGGGYISDMVLYLCVCMLCVRLVGLRVWLKVEEGWCGACDSWNLFENDDKFPFSNLDFLIDSKNSTNTYIYCERERERNGRQEREREIEHIKHFKEYLRLIAVIPFVHILTELLHTVFQMNLVHGLKNNQSTLFVLRVCPIILNAGGPSSQ